MSKRFVAGLAVMTVGLWSGSTVAHAATTEVRVVSTFMYEDATGELFNADSGWAASGDGTGTVEIGSAYGAPTGLGREAVMLDTPAVGDRAIVHALTDQGYYAGAFPEPTMVTPDRHIGFWLYLSSASSPGSSPVMEAWVAKSASHVIITFDPAANGYTAVDEWMYVDATAAGAEWTVRQVGSDDSQRETMTWQQIVDYTVVAYEGGWLFGAFDYGLQFYQQAPGAFSAIDGVTVSTVPGSTVANFELQPASGRPQLDDCKNDGWQTHPAGPFKNQGSCVAAIAAAQ